MIRVGFQRGAPGPQVTGRLGAGVLLFPALGLGSMSLGNDPLALVLVCLVIVLCSTSLGILIASIAHSEGQIGGLSSALLWGAGFLGGSIVPAFMFPEAFRERKSVEAFARVTSNTRLTRMGSSPTSRLTSPSSVRINASLTWIEMPP